MSDAAAWLNFQGAYKESGEALWYQSYSIQPPADAPRPWGTAPFICNRLSRLPRIEQLGMAIDLAAAVWTGDAIYRGMGDNQVTGEEYWFWPGRPEAKYPFSLWWMLPARTTKLARRAMENALAAAEASQRRRGRRAAQQRLMATWQPMSHEDAVMIELRRLQRRARQAAAATRLDGYVPEYWPSPLGKRPAPRPGKAIDYAHWPEWARPAGAIYAGTVRSAYAPASRAWSGLSKRLEKNAVKKLAILHHVTLTTGDIAVTTRSDMADDIPAMIRPVIEAGSGELSGVCVRVLSRRRTSVALALCEPAAVYLTVCWGDAATSRVAWKTATDKEPTAASIKRPATPWAAVTLDLQVLAELPRETTDMLGDLERCIAWTLIEGA